MEAIRKTIRVPKDHQITIQVPPHIKTDTLAEVLLIVPEASEGDADKIAFMQQALNDELFLQDMQEVQEDFKYIDRERWHS